MTNIVEVLKKHSRDIPNKILYTYIEESSEPSTLTFSEVDYHAKKIATELLKKCKKGDRALMLYPSGLEFITAFIACLYAGVIAVPAYPPRRNQKLDRLKSIIADSDASIVLTTEKTAKIGKPLFNSDTDLSSLTWLETDIEDKGELGPLKVDINDQDIAFLQYTSGSTGTPKGVIVTHANIMSNMETLHQLMNTDKESIGTSWLPHFHDMGLIGGVLQPLYVGFEAILMSPTYFLQKPVRWLRVISEYNVDASIRELI